MKRACYGSKWLETRSFLRAFVPSVSLAALAFQEPQMSSGVGVTSPRLLWEAEVECRLPGTTYRCDPALQV